MPQKMPKARSSALLIVIMRHPKVTMSDVRFIAARKKQIFTITLFHHEKMMSEQPTALYLQILEVGKSSCVLQSKALQFSLLGMKIGFT